MSCLKCAWVTLSLVPQFPQLEFCELTGTMWEQVPGPETASVCRPLPALQGKRSGMESCLRAAPGPDLGFQSEPRSPPTRPRPSEIHVELGVPCWGNECSEQQRQTLKLISRRRSLSTGAGGSQNYPDGRRLGPQKGGGQIVIQAWEDGGSLPSEASARRVLRTRGGCQRWAGTSAHI